jgi:hypothetical protein
VPGRSILLRLRLGRPRPYHVAGFFRCSARRSKSASALMLFTEPRSRTIGLAGATYLCDAEVNAS